MYFGNADNFSVGSLESVVELHEVPELGLGNDLVLGEDSHGVEILLGILSLVSKSSSNNQKLSDLRKLKKVPRNLPQGAGRLRTR